jgi:hypothetical protein
MQPAIGYDADEICGWERIHDRHSDNEDMFFIDTILFQRKGLVVQNALTVHIFNNDVEELTVPMNINVELKGGNQRQLNPKHRSRDWLNHSRYIKSGELADKLVQDDAHLWDTHELT